MQKHYDFLHALNFFHKKSFLHDKYNDLLISDTLRNIALSMISIFIPIFLLEEGGFTLLEICWMELFLFIGTIIFHYYALNNIVFWGVKRSLVISNFLNIIFVLLMYFSGDLISDFGKITFLVLISIFNITAMAIYWTAHHVYFLKSTKHKTLGKKLGLLSSIPTILSITSPFIGSILITKFEFYGTFLFSTLLLILASCALFMSDNIRIKIKLDFKKVLDFQNKSKNLIYFIQGVGFAATAFVWPVLLFLLSIKLISMGFLYLFSNIIYSFSTYYAGKNSDKKGGSRKITRISSIGHGCSLIFRSLSETIFPMTTFQMMGGLFGGMMLVALEAGFYKHTKKDLGNSIMNRELYMHSGRIFTILILILGLYFLPPITAFITALIVAGIATFTLNILAKYDNSVVC